MPPPTLTNQKEPDSFRTLLVTSFNGGIGLPTLMALMGHVTPEMTLRYAKLASGDHPGRIPQRHRQDPHRPLDADRRHRRRTAGA